MRAAADQTLSLATLPAGLRLTVTGTYTGWVERGRTDTFAGLSLAGATGKTGIGSRVSQPQPARGRELAGRCRSDQCEKQRQAQ
jgi:hypothetical protein